jgi:hypothetical protein
MASINDVKISVADYLVEEIEGYQEDELVVSAYVIDDWLQIDNIFDNGDQYVIRTIFDGYTQTTIVSGEQIKAVRYTWVGDES